MMKSIMQNAMSCEHAEQGQGHTCQMKGMMTKIQKTCEYTMTQEMKDICEEVFIQQKTRDHADLGQGHM